LPPVYFVGVSDLLGVVSLQSIPDKISRGYPWPAVDRISPANSACPRPPANAGYDIPAQDAKFIYPLK